jgi:hypothetical protein
MTRVLNHIRNNLVGYIALFVALGGTSYAAMTISGSQIRNRSIDSVKLNPRSVAASVRAWVIVASDGSHARAAASSAQVHVEARSFGEELRWPHLRFGRHCLASVTPQAAPSSHFVSTTASFDSAHGDLQIYGFGPAEPGHPQAAYVMIVCP